MNSPDEMVFGLSKTEIVTISEKSHKWVDRNHPKISAVVGGSFIEAFRSGAEKINTDESLKQMFQKDISDIFI